MRFLPFALVAIAVAVRAQACSCLPAPSVETSFAKASAVFIATVVDDTQVPILGADGKPAFGWWTEYATMRVEKAWKGVKAGQIVKFKSPIGAGPCGMPSRGENTFIKLGLLPSDHEQSRSAQNNTRWLVYAFGSEPFMLSGCSRSYLVGSPRDRADISALDRLTSHNR